MKIALPFVIGGVLAASLLSACSKAGQSKSRTERIAEIDAILASPPTGAPENANYRASLRAERLALSGYNSVSASQAALQQQEYARTQDQRERQRVVDQLKNDAERSRYAEQQRLQAQRDQWERENRAFQRKLNGNFRAEAPAPNTYDVQVERTRTTRP